MTEEDKAALLALESTMDEGMPVRPPLTDEQWDEEQQKANQDNNYSPDVTSKEFSHFSGNHYPETDSDGYY